MKIVIIKENNPFYTSSASANRWRTLIEGLASNGVELTIIVICGYQSLDEYEKSCFFNNISVVNTYYFINNSLWKRRLSKYIIQPLFRKYNYNKVEKIIENISPDILWIERRLETMMLYSKLRLSKNNNFKTMIELSEYDDVSVVSNIFQKYKFDKTKKLFRDEIVPQVDIFTIMTKTLFQYYQNLSSNRASYIHLPMTVDFSRFENFQGNPLEKPYIMYCGTLSDKKDGVDILIKAFAKISDTFHDLKLYLVGDYYPDTINQKRVISQLKLNNKVIYLGSKHRDEIPDLLKGASVLALARPDSKQAQGGFPTKLGEYLATGNPVCVTRTGEIAEYLTDNDNAFLAEPNSVDSFANALERALSDRENAIRIGMNGRKIAEEHFNMDKQARKLYIFLRDAVKC